MKKKLSTRIAAVVASISVGLGFTQVAAADTYSTSISSPITRATSHPDGVSVEPGSRMVVAAEESSVSALATKLGEKEETVADALVAVRKLERSAAISTAATDLATRVSRAAARQAAVARALAAELGIDVSKVSASLTELQGERKASRTSAGQ
ncbi:MAG: hypothetical protein ACTHWA_11145 [Arachnia sp.]